MIQYFIIIFLLFIFIYLIKNNCFSTIENIEDNVSTSNTETWTPIFLTEEQGLILKNIVDVIFFG